MKRLGLIFGLFAGSAAAEAPRIVADIAPVQSLVAMVTEGVTTPDLLLEATQDAHHAALTPAQAQSLQDADLIVWIGPGLTPWLSEGLETVASGAAVLRLGGRDEDVVLEMRGHHGGHDHSHHEADPHGWLDPSNAASWLGVIAEQVSALDPDNAEVYEANRAQAQEKLTAVDAELRSMIKPSDQKIMMGHDSLQYFENAYNISFAGALSDSEDIDPTANEIRELRQTATGGDVACLLIDQETSASMVETVTEGTDLKRVDVDPIGRTLPPGPDLYVDLLMAIGTSVVECLE